MVTKVEYARVLAGLNIECQVVVLGRSDQIIVFVRSRSSLQSSFEAKEIIMLKMLKKQAKGNQTQ